MNFRPALERMPLVSRRRCAQEAGRQEQAPHPRAPAVSEPAPLPLSSSWRLPGALQGSFWQLERRTRFPSAAGSSGMLRESFIGCQAKFKSGLEAFEWSVDPKHRRLTRQAGGLPCGCTGEDDSERPKKTLLMT